MSDGRRLITGRSIRWDKQRAARAYEAGHWVRTTLADTLEEAASHSPERILLIDEKHSMDCRTLHAEAVSLAHALLSRAPSGSVISYILPNWHEAVVIYLGATLAGMVVNPILPSLRDRELKFILEDVDSRLVFVPHSFRRHDYAEMLGRVAADLPRAPDVVVLRGDPKGDLAYEKLVGQPGDRLPLAPVDPDAVRMVLYTSGTTGQPKGVLHSHNSIHALMFQFCRHWMVEPGDVLLVPSPVGHITGSMCAVEAPLLLGATAVLMDRWNADEAVQLIDTRRCTHMVGATPFLSQLLAAANQVRSQLPSLKLFACGGASVPPSLIHDAVASFERAVVTRVYGSTEVPQVTAGATGPGEAWHAAETDGRADLAEIKLVDHPAAPPGEGEVHARGPQMLVGYINPADEVEAFDDEGFFRMGDLARWVDDKYLLVTGRVKDIIIRSGENISPKEIEDLLITHPDIAEVAIIGLPDPKTGERACAAIVPERAPGPDVTSLRLYLANLGVASFKAPEQVVILDALPRNDAGKVLKHRIRQQMISG